MRAIVSGTSFQSWVVKAKNNIEIIHIIRGNRHLVRIIQARVNEKKRYGAGLGVGGGKY